MFAAAFAEDGIFPLPKALALALGYLKLDQLVLALWRLSPWCFVSAARHTSPLGLEKKPHFETNKGKFTSWCELPLEHLLPLDRSVLAHSRLR